MAEISSCKPVCQVAAGSCSGSATIERVDLKNLSPQELNDFVQRRGWEPYRAQQIMTWLYKKGVSSIDSMTDLSKRLRDELNRVAFVSRLVPERILVSTDGSRKYLFPLEKDCGVESVLMSVRDHYTVCVSTQLGCALKCRFCCTGTIGLKRNLSTAEIVNQIDAVLSDLDDRRRLVNIVFMGMGEPLANYQAVVKALAIIFHTYGYDFSHRRVTLSTAGLIPQLQQLGRDFPVNLAVSLNAADSETRSYLMPINRTYSLPALLAVLKDYPLTHRKRITMEYLLIDGINDSLEDARKLVKLLRPLKCKINLIPFNEHAGSEFTRPSQERIDAFWKILVDSSYTAIVRESKGRDIMAACGQLAGGRAVDSRQRRDFGSC